jgi:hypothetical protein
MPDVPRIDVGEARGHMAKGGALLVCAYEDETKCRQIALPGAVPLTQLEQRATAMPKNQELIFYCA